MSTSKSKANGVAAVATDSKLLTKHLVLVHKPIYLGFYVGVDAEDDLDAVKKIRERFDSDDDLESKVTDLFGEARITAHTAVSQGVYINVLSESPQEIRGVYVNAGSDFDYEIGGSVYHSELDMRSVLNLADLPKAQQYMGGEIPVAFDLTNEQGMQTT
jgi:hypothetical protein